MDRIAPFDEAPGRIAKSGPPGTSEEKRTTEELIPGYRPRRLSLVATWRGTDRGMHFGVEAESDIEMLTAIEEVVIKTPTGLCESCVHAEHCVYRRNATKAVIECEVFESADDAVRQLSAGGDALRGLCLNCSKNYVCSLPKKVSGVWHCEEYE